MAALLLNFLKAWWPQISAICITFSLGFTAAWQVQGLRIDAVNNDKEELRLEFDSWRYSLQQQEADLATQRATIRQTESIKYEELKNELEKQIKSGDTYRRCVAAGKCGVRVQHVQTGSTCTINSVQTSNGTDATSTDTIPIAGDSTAEVVADCARTTLQLNMLQESKTNQPGYTEASK